MFLYSYKKNWFSPHSFVVLVVTIDSCQQVNNIKVNPIIDFYTPYRERRFLFFPLLALIVLVVYLQNQNSPNRIQHELLQLRLSILQSLITKSFYFAKFTPQAVLIFQKYTYPR